MRNIPIVLIAADVLLLPARTKAQSFHPNENRLLTVCSPVTSRTDIITDMFILAGNGASGNFEKFQKIRRINRIVTLPFE